MSQQPIRVCYPFIGDGIGGSHISALKLISQIDRKLVEPLIVLHQPDGILSKFIHELGLEYVGLPKLELIAPAARQGSSKTKLGDYFGKTLPFLRRFLRSRRVQIVHTNDGRIHVTWALAARLAMSKVVWHHRADPDARGVNLVAPLLANQIISVSLFSQPRRPILPVSRKLTVVRSPFEHPQSVMDKGEARRAVIDELGCARQTRLLGYFGGLIERKRPLLFVDIIKNFSERYPDIPVAGLLYGINSPDGPDFSARIHERAHELGIVDRIFQMGFRQPIEPHFRAMDIMLVPAVNEPFGRTLIEAMMLGTPVIATNHGGNPEAITDGVNGFLVDPENADAFVRPIHALLTDDGIAKRIRDAALASSHERYSAAAHVTQITNIYKKLA